LRASRRRPERFVMLCVGVVEYPNMAIAYHLMLVNALLVDSILVRFSVLTRSFSYWPLQDRSGSTYMPRYLSNGDASSWLPCSIGTWTVEISFVHRLMYNWLPSSCTLVALATILDGAISSPVIMQKNDTTFAWSCTPSRSGS
jgi:hypothetical protein